MRARVGFILPLVVSLLAGNERAHGQSESSNVHVLPRIVVVTRTAPRAKPSRAQNAPRVIRPAPTPVAYPRTPIAGSGIDIDKAPASVNTVDVNQTRFRWGDRDGRFDDLPYRSSGCDKCFPPRNRDIYHRNH